MNLWFWNTAQLILWKRDEKTSKTSGGASVGLRGSNPQILLKPPDFYVK